jgi:hypothetical protein
VIPILCSPTIRLSVDRILEHRIDKRLESFAPQSLFVDFTYSCHILRLEFSKGTAYITLVSKIPPPPHPPTPLGSVAPTPFEPQGRDTLAGGGGGSWVGGNQFRRREIHSGTLCIL